MTVCGLLILSIGQHGVFASPYQGVEQHIDDGGPFGPAPGGDLLALVDTQSFVNDWACRGVLKVNFLFRV